MLPGRRQPYTSRWCARSAEASASKFTEIMHSSQLKDLSFSHKNKKCLGLLKHVNLLGGQVWRAKNATVNVSFNQLLV